MFRERPGTSINFQWQYRGALLYAHSIAEAALTSMSLLSLKKRACMHDESLPESKIPTTDEPQLQGTWSRFGTATWTRFSAYRPIMAALPLIEFRCRLLCHLCYAVRWCRGCAQGVPRARHEVNGMLMEFGGKRLWATCQAPAIPAAHGGQPEGPDGNPGHGAPADPFRQQVMLLFRHCLCVTEADLCCLDA